MIRRLTPSLLFAALAGILFFRVLFLGETLIATDILAASPVWRVPPGPIRNPWLSDTVEYYYPAEKLYSEHVRRGELPVTNPYLFNGAPIPQGAHIWNSVWPVKLLFLGLFDPVRSYDLFAIFHFWLAAVGMLAFLRARGRGPFPAFLGALAYVLSGRSMLWLHGHYLMATLAYAPLAFLGAQKRSMLAAIPVAGLFFTNPQMALAIGAAVWLFERSSWRAILAGVLMAGVALVPLGAAVLGGLRDPVAEANWFYRDRWRCWFLLGELLVPGKCLGQMNPNEYNSYLGLVPLAGALAAFRKERFFAGLAVAGLVVSTCWPIPLWVSPVSFSLPTRYLFFVAFGGAVCFARALELRPLSPAVRVALVALVLVDLAPRFYLYNRSYDPSILRERPPALMAIRGRVGWSFAKNPALKRAIEPPLWLFGVASVQGYDVMVPRAQREAIRGAGEVWGDRIIHLTDPESPALEALGMRTYLTDRPFQGTRFRPVYSGSVTVYENPRAPDVPPRQAPLWPLWVGLGVTLLGSVLAALWGLLDPLSRGRYS
jgi:hypothetical protein